MLPNSLLQTPCKRTQRYAAPLHARIRTVEEVTGILVPLLGGIMRDSQRGFEAMAAAVKARAEALPVGT